MNNFHNHPIENGKKCWPDDLNLLMPFDYTLSEDEKPKYAGKLHDKQIVVGMRELVPFGGRLRARGAIISGPDGKSYTHGMNPEIYALSLLAWQLFASLSFLSESTSAAGNPARAPRGKHPSVAF